MKEVRDGPFATQTRRTPSLPPQYQHHIRHWQQRHGKTTSVDPFESPLSLSFLAMSTMA